MEQTGENGLLLPNSSWNSAAIKRKVLAMKTMKSVLLLIVFSISAFPQKPLQGNGTRSDWVLRFDGIGAVKIGMTVGQLNAALGETFSTPKAQDEQTCFYVEPKQHPDTTIMILEGRVARVDIIAPNTAPSSTATAEGIRIGDSEARVKKVYGRVVAVSPHQYTPDGHYLTIKSGKYGLRFETEQNKVTSFYAGTLDAIAFVEGCL